MLGRTRMGNWGAFGARVIAFAAAVSLAGCLTGTNPSGNDDIVGGAPIDPVQSQALPPPDGSAQPGTTGAMPTQMGTGPVKVALILPLTQAGVPSNVGVSLRNAADLALSEAGTADVTLLVKDDQSTPDGATAAAQSALTDGADLIIGPLYAANVRAAEQVVNPAHKPMIAFSTDASTAEPGVYLLSFLVESYVDRIVDFAASKGKRSFAAMIPDNDYGRIAAAEFQQEAARRGVRVMEIENYDPNSIERCGEEDRRARQSDRRALHPRAGGRHAGCGAGARRERARCEEGAEFSAPGFGTIRACWRCRRCKALGSRRPTIRASRHSRRAIARNTAAIRRASRRSAMMRSHWLSRLRIGRGRTASPTPFSPITRASMAPTASSDSAPTG